MIEPVASALTLMTMRVVLTYAIDKETHCSLLTGGSSEQDPVHTIMTNTVKMIHALSILGAGIFMIKI